MKQEIEKISGYRKLQEVMIKNPNKKYIMSEWLETNSYDGVYEGNWFLMFSPERQAILDNEGFCDINCFLMSSDDYQLHPSELQS